MERGLSASSGASSGVASGGVGPAAAGRAPEDESEGATQSEDEAGRQLLARARVSEIEEVQRQLAGLGQVQPAAARPGRDTMGSWSRGIMSLIGRRRRPGGPPEAAGEAEEDEDQEHPLLTCDGCHEGPPLIGRVMHCADCEDFDLCMRCFRNLDRLGHPTGHRFRARAPESRRAAPTHFLLQMIEEAMLNEALRRSGAESSTSREDEQRRIAARGAEVLARMPREPWSPALDADGFQGCECALCLEDYDHGEEVLKLPCAHFFHEACLKPWFAKSLLCPLCQREVPADESPSDSGSS